MRNLIQYTKPDIQDYMLSVGDKITSAIDINMSVPKTYNHTQYLTFISFW